MADYNFPKLNDEEDPSSFDVKGSTTPISQNGVIPGKPSYVPNLTPMPPINPLPPQDWQGSAGHMPPPPSAVPNKPAALPGMPQGFGADDFQNYLTQQKQNLNKYGPDAQMALQQKTLADRNGLGNELKSGLKGFSDALMQGVAGAGNPGNQQAFENQQDQRAREQMDTMQKAGEGQRQNTEAGMKLDMMDAKSPISKAYRDSFTPIFSKMGYSPRDIAKMSASQISTVADLGVRYADAQTQMELKKAMLGVETFKVGADVQNKQTQREQEQEKLGIEHPIQKMLGMLPGSASSPSSVPSVGGMFNGEKVRSVTRIK